MRIYLPFESDGPGRADAPIHVALKNEKGLRILIYYKGVPMKLLLTALLIFLTDPSPHQGGGQYCDGRKPSKQTDGYL